MKGLTKFSLVLVVAIAGGLIAPATSNATTTARALPSPADENNLSAIALVFDRLSTNGRARSHAAALAIITDRDPVCGSHSPSLMRAAHEVISTTKRQAGG